MTYNVFGVTLNLTQSINQSGVSCCYSSLSSGRDGWSVQLPHIAISCHVRGFCSTRTGIVGN